MRSKVFYLFIFICITRVIGFIFFPFLLKTSPIVLIVLSPFLHHLMLTSSLIAPFLFLFLGISISIFQCSVGFEFGKKYGLSGLEWVQRHHLISYSKVSALTGWLQYSSALILFLIPGPLVAMVAGVSRLEPKKFYAIMIPSQTLWIIVCLYLGVGLEPYLVVGKNYVIENGLVISCVLIAINLWQRKNAS